MEFLLCRSRQICFASITSLKRAEPIPHSNLGWQRVSHLTQWIFLWSPFWPHQNFLMRFSISLHRPKVSLKQLIRYVGIAQTTTLIKISLPAWDKSFSFQPWNFLHAFSLMKLKLAFFLHPTKEGKPSIFRKEGKPSIFRIVWFLGHPKLAWCG